MTERDGALPTTEPHRIFVIADDLTGSVDATVCFHTQDTPVRISINHMAPWDDMAASRTVQVYNSESRHLPVGEAAKRVKDAVRTLKERYTLFRLYKKVDSTLRGNVGAEIEAALNGLGLSIAVLAPAFPEQKRAVRNGELHVNGAPMTRIDSDDVRPELVNRHHVSNIVCQTTGLPTTLLSLGVIRAGLEAVRHALSDLPFERGIVIADAENAEDIQTVAVAATNGSVLLCGSGGMAKALSNIWLHGYNAPVTYNTEEVARVLVVVGSHHRQSQRQFEQLIQQSNVLGVSLSPELLANDDLREVEFQRVSSAMAATDANCVAVRITPHVVKDNRFTPTQFSEWLAQLCGGWIMQQAQSQTKVGIVVAGGDTLLALCRSIGVRELWPQGNVVSGVPWSIIRGPRTRWSCVSKSGAFGDERALLDAVRFFQHAQ